MSLIKFLYEVGDIDVQLKIKREINGEAADDEEDEGDDEEEEIEEEKAESKDGRSTAQGITYALGHLAAILHQGSPILYDRLDLFH